MSLTNRDRLRGRVGLPGVLAMAQHAGNVSKRIVAQAAKAAANSGGAAAAGAAAAALYRSKGASAPGAGPAFNPGSAGGWKGKLKKRKKSKKATSKAKTLEKFRHKVFQAVYFRKFADLRQSYIFAIQTSNSFPVIAFGGPYNQVTTGLTTSGLCPSAVGWNLIEGPTADQLRTELKEEAQPIINMPWDTSGINTMHAYDLNDVAPASYQISIERKLHFLFEIRNNSNVGAKITLYLMRAKADTGISSYDELLDLRDANYIDATSPVSGTVPATITRDFEQYMKVPLHGKKRIWAVESEVSMVLNAGDVARQSMTYDCVIPHYETYPQSYAKGQWQILARIEGSLAVDTSDPSQYNYAGAVVGCHYSRHMRCAMSRKEFDVVTRVGAVEAGTVVTPVVAQDGNVANANM